MGSGMAKTARTALGSWRHCLTRMTGARSGIIALSFGPVQHHGTERIGLRALVHIGHPHALARRLAARLSIHHAHMRTYRSGAGWTMTTDWGLRAGRAPCSSAMMSSCAVRRVDSSAPRTGLCTASLIL